MSGAFRDESGNMACLFNRVCTLGDRMEAGKSVRLLHDPNRIGITTGLCKSATAGYMLIQVQFISGRQYIPEDQLIPHMDVLSPIEQLADATFSEPDVLRRMLTHVRLSGRLVDMIYSLEATNTDFHAYQFKPVLKMLSSPSNGLLIADEVGLGKTIEAGLIWTELRSRFDYRRLMVLCPSMLREKWRWELSHRFGIEALLADASQVTDAFERSKRLGSYGEFALIGSMQGLRRSESLRELLDREADGEPLLDLLVIDEAHYLKNSETSTAALGRALRRLSEHVVLLSATPVHLGNQDLFQLLNIIDPDTFERVDVFDEVLKANGPLVRAVDHVLDNRVSREQIWAGLLNAQEHPMLNGSRQLEAVIEELKGNEALSVADRSKIAFQLGEVNLLGQTVTRTRKRDVQEWKVVREPIPESIQMHPIERVLYDRVTALVQSYCEAHRANQGFLLVMPQRQLSSSMPAALRSWRKRAGVDWNELDLGEQITLPDRSESLGPVMSELLRHLEDYGDPQTLAAIDSKYSCMLHRLKAYFSDSSGEKVVLFAYFRETLAYLSERLSKDGIKNLVLVGGSIDKEVTLAKFRDDPEIRILLSSEVASEGIDLQFCRLLINYDLPWNPMKVEQRIGRIDRLGQKAQKILIWNMFYAGTIDMRIYDRLFARLEIFKYALGDIEPILGSVFRELTIDLMSGKLTPEEEERRIDTAAQAIQNVRDQEIELERQSANLIAHGDFILRKVETSRSMQRWVDATDVSRYVVDYFTLNYPGCQFRHYRDDPSRVDILLSIRAQLDLEEFISQRRLSKLTRLIANDTHLVPSRFSRNLASEQTRKGEEHINHLHQVVQFVNYRLSEPGALQGPAIALYVDSDVLNVRIAPGTYAFTVMLWKVKGLTIQEKLDFQVVLLVDGTMILNETDAEGIVLGALSEGRHWIEVPNDLDLSDVHAVADGVCHTRSIELFEQFWRDIENKNLDRAQFQEQSLLKHLENQTRIKTAIREEHKAKGRDSLAKAMDGQIDKLKNRVAKQLERIIMNRSVIPERMDVCAGVIRVI